MVPRWLDCGKHILSLTRGKFCGRPWGHGGTCFPVPLGVDYES